MSQQSTAVAESRASEAAYDRARVEALLAELSALDLGAEGRVAHLVESPAPGERSACASAEVVVGKGLAGDYARKDFYKGRRVPGREVSAVSLEVLRVLGARDPIAIGDNLVTEGIDLRALRPGDRLRVGAEVVLCRSERPHRPCTPFRARTSPEAFAAVARGDYRGALFVVERGGTVRPGDVLRPADPPPQSQ